MKIKLFTLPNLLTACNALSGMLSIGFALLGQLEYAVWFIILGAIFDVFDGLVARSMKISSPIGKQLDSLADVITFGLAPGAMMFRVLLVLCSEEYRLEVPMEEILTLHIQDLYTGDLLVFLALLIPLLTVFRLAKFNVDERQSTDFIGLPSPASAILFCSFALALVYHQWPLWLNAFAVVLCIILVSLCLISEIHLFSFKWKGKPWSQYKLQGILLVSSLAIIFVCKAWSIALIVFLYLILSIVFYRPQNKEENEI